MLLLKREEKILLTDFHEADIFKVACRLEKIGIDFYSSLMKQAKNKLTRTLFERLAGEEKKHLLHLQRYFKGILSTRSQGTMRSSRRRYSG